MTQKPLISGAFEPLTRPSSLAHLHSGDCFLFVLMCFPSLIVYFYHYPLLFVTLQKNLVIRGGGGKLVQWLKCLLCKHKVQSSKPQNLCKCRVGVLTFAAQL